jgi:hypothetical protein
MTAPVHERERANAVPSLVRSMWEEIAALARELGVESSGDGSAREPGFDPDVYAGVYERLLRHRHTQRLDVTSVLTVRASVYDALDAAVDLVPTPAEVARVMAEIEFRPEGEVEREVADWYRL